MKPVLKAVDFPATESNLRATDNFGFEIVISVGVEGEDFVDDFFAFVCSPKWLSENMSDDVLSGAKMFFQKEFDLDQLRAAIEELLLTCVGDDWQDIASKFGKFAEWEFEGFKGWTDIHGNLLPIDEPNQ